MLALIFAVLFVALPVWAWMGAAAAASVALFMVSLSALVLIWKTQRLELWLSQTDLHSHLPWSGVWSEIALRIQRLLRLREKQAADAEQRLQYFLQAIQASPSGVTLLDAQGRIEWCNATASGHLGLDARRDLKQHIVHLVRDPVFSKYFSMATHEEEVVIDGRTGSLAKARKLSLQLHTYGQGQQLLLSRDITSVTMAEAMRRDFVANVSHEIRTPLTVLGGFVETLQSIPLGADEQQRYLSLMAVQADRMQNLVADLLTLSQLEGSLPAGLHQQVDLPELMDRLAADAAALSSVLSVMEVEAPVPVHQLVFEPSPEWALLGVRSELLSAMSNLVSNAIRYTPAGGSVHVGWQRTADWASFFVTDSGPGIAPEHLPRLSERFYRVDRSRSRETGGTGLGLAIAKHVAQRHGGELRIESRLGQGSTFQLVLPASRIVPIAS